jgi:hypothetical protein
MHNKKLLLLFKKSSLKKIKEKMNINLKLKKIYKKVLIEKIEKNYFFK